MAFFRFPQIFGFHAIRFDAASRTIAWNSRNNERPNLVLPQ
jgi:hypothetical protein